MYIATCIPDFSCGKEMHTPISAMWHPAIAMPMQKSPNPSFSRKLSHLSSSSVTFHWYSLHEEQLLAYLKQLIENVWRKPSELTLSGCDVIRTTFFTALIYLTSASNFWIVSCLALRWKSPPHPAFILPSSILASDFTWHCRILTFPTEDFSCPEVLSSIFTGRSKRSFFVASFWLSW